MHVWLVPFLKLLGLMVLARFVFWAVHKALSEWKNLLVVAVLAAVGSVAVADDTPASFTSGDGTGWVFVSQIRVYRYVIGTDVATYTSDTGSSGSGDANADLINMQSESGGLLSISYDAVSNTYTVSPTDVTYAMDVTASNGDSVSTTTCAPSVSGGYTVEFLRIENQLVRVEAVCWVGVGALLARVFFASWKR